MTTRKILTIFLLFSVVLTVSGQDVWYGSTAGLKSVFNPAFSGVSGRNEIRISEYSFMPGGGYGLNTFTLVSDNFVPYLHGGISGWIIDDLTGSIANDLRSGISWSYHFRAGDRIYVTAGLAASVIHFGINRSKVIFPDDIDPFTGQVSSAGEDITPGGFSRFDATAGFTVSGSKWYGGFAVSHLTMPYMSADRNEDSRLPRKYVADAGAFFSQGEDRAVIQPSLTVILQGSSLAGNAGVTLSRGGLSGGISMWMVKNGFAAIQPSAGWSTQSLSIGLTYSYNIGTQGLNVPATALVRASVTIFLGNVEKRKPLHVIMLPEL